MSSKKRVPTLVNDGERMIPEYHKDNLFYVEHMTRYSQTKDVVRDKVVLDIASGSGYGTQIIAQTASKVIGVDVSKVAVDYARENYSAKNIEYIVGDGERIPLDDKSVDVVTSFETIEHIPDYRQFLSEVTRVVKDDGLVVVSTPNDLEYAEGNHHHLYEFKYEELKSLLKTHFKYIDAYFQSTWKGVLLDKLDGHTTDNDRTLKVKNYSPLNNVDKTLYFYFVCSNKPIKESIEPIVGLGPHLSEASDWIKEKGYLDRISELNERVSIMTEDLNDAKSRLADANSLLSDPSKLAELISGKTLMKHALKRQVKKIKKRM